MLPLRSTVPTTAERVGLRLLGAIQTPPPKKVTRRVDKQPFAGGDPLLEGVIRLFSIGLRHVYAALWRVGVLEIQA